VTTTPDTTATAGEATAAAGSWLPFPPAPPVARHLPIVGMADVLVHRTESRDGTPMVEVAHRGTPDSPVWVGDVTDACELARAVLAVVADASSRAGVS